jgi:hypothetical protein
MQLNDLLERRTVNQTMTVETIHLLASDKEIQIGMQSQLSNGYFADQYIQRTLKSSVNEASANEDPQNTDPEYTGRDSSFNEDELLETVRGAVIISDTAGMGKSTILSHFYNKLKSTRPSTWVLRVNLMDQHVAEAIGSQLAEGKPLSATEFLERLASV